MHDRHAERGLATCSSKTPLYAACRSDLAHLDTHPCFDPSAQDLCHSTILSCSPSAAGDAARRASLSRQRSWVLHVGWRGEVRVPVNEECWQVRDVIDGARHERERGRVLQSTRSASSSSSGERGQCRQLCACRARPTHALPLTLSSRDWSSVGESCWPRTRAPRPSAWPSERKARGAPEASNMAPLRLAPKLFK